MLNIFQQKSKYEFNKHSTFHSYCTKFNVNEVFCLLFLIKLCNFKAEKRKHTHHKDNKPWQKSRDMLCYTLHSAS